MSSKEDHLAWSWKVGVGVGVQDRREKSLSWAFGNNMCGLQEERAWEMGSLLWLEQKRGGGKE